jgi:RNA polymerase sigma-70 factor (ECF subfamily)
VSESAVDARAAVEQLYRSESRRVLATLIRLLGDFDRAEEALHDAFVVALERWPAEGIPANPRAWLVSTGRFRAIDAIRRRASFDEKQAELARELTDAARREPGLVEDDDAIPDDRLRLIFTCCHPALAPDAQVALTLRTVGGLTTEEIAASFLVPAPTVAQRIVRAKGKIRDAGIPYEIPGAADLAERVDAVLAVIYLIFNEGYSASSGASVVRADLCAEAIRLGRMLVELLPDAEAEGLLALMLLHDARRPARASHDGELVLLEHQDRSLWNRDQITEGVARTERALRSRRYGSYAIQAAVAAIHAEAESAADTDWRQIIGLYDVQLRMHPSPVIELNRAAAIAMSGEVARALALIDALIDGGGLARYHLAHSARADLLRRLGRLDEASLAYSAALAMAGQEPERRFLERRLAETRGG